MKSLAITLFIAVIATINMSEAVPTESLLKTITDCKIKNKVTDSELMLYLSNKLPDSQNIQCFTACALNKLEMMKDSKLDNDGIVKFFTETLAKPDHKERASNIGIECASQVDANGKNECELAHVFSVCVHSNPGFADILPALLQGRGPLRF